jgi:hypothetical protein
MERQQIDRQRENGLPAGIRSGIEAISGHALDDVQVHRNSPRPAEVGALAFTQGNQIHVAPGQDHHLAHEAWHVVQQREGRVPVTGSVAGQPLNDDHSLEHEADVMSARAASVPVHSVGNLAG